MHVHTNGSAALAQSYLPTSRRVTPLMLRETEANMSLKSLYAQDAQPV